MNRERTEFCEGVKMEIPEKTAEAERAATINATVALNSAMFTFHSLLKTNKITTSIISYFQSLL